MKKLKTTLIKFTGMVAGLTLSANSLGLETDLLELKEGFVGDIVSAEIEKISMQEGGGMLVEITLPIPPENVENVFVVDDDAPVKPIRNRTEIRKNLDTGETGVLIYFDKRRKFPIKLNLELNEEK